MRTAILVVSLTFAGWGLAGDADYTERMAREHAAEAPAPSAAARMAPGRAVTGRTVQYAVVDGLAVDGYLSTPEDAGPPRPGLIVIHEWWGLNDNVRAMADRLAGEGYAALAVDLYAGGVARDSDRARELMRAALDDPEALRDNLRQAYAYLNETMEAPRIGSIGWCFGGGWSLQTALMFPDALDAAVIYYGRLVTDPDELEALEMPILGLFGAEDRGIPVETVREFENALNELGKDATIRVYEGADHAFANPSGERYKADAAEAAWAETTAFLARHLKP